MNIKNLCVSLNKFEHPVNKFDKINFFKINAF